MRRIIICQYALFWVISCPLINQLCFTSPDRENLADTGSKEGMEMNLKALNLAAILSLAGVMAAAQSQPPTVSKLEDYNGLLPHWGISWSPGAMSVNGYYPSFYTGFVMRSEFPERIHVHTARGNQTRVSVILDEATLRDYLFDLVKRNDFYKKVTTGPNAKLNVNPSGAKFLPQLSFFRQIIESKEYGIQEFVAKAKANEVSEEEVYTKSLQVLSQLNPGRVRMLQIDLKNEFLRWKADLLRRSGGDVAKVTTDAKAVVESINTLVWGRINYIEKPTPDVLAKLGTAAQLAVSNAPEDQLFAAAVELLKASTGTKYQIKVLTSQGQWQSAIQCSSSQCTLTYPEFTAIYPTGSVMEKTHDEFGNTINSFATTGLWQFLNYGGKEVDNIRNEPFYGFIPKMDYEGIGNGFHNPAVRFWDPSRALKAALGINPAHDTLWAVKRGGVSHGCLRLPAGHVWELRQIFPVENSKMIQIPFFANNATDFDLYDIDGDGDLEVIGVQYLISYGLQGTDGLARREGKDFEVNADKKRAFYDDLYGARNVFNVIGNDQYVFENPKVSLHSYLDAKKHGVSTRVTLAGTYPLFEAAYEKEKVQMYGISGSIDGANRQMVRLMGRVRGCSPKADKNACGENAFDNEAKGLVAP